MGEFFRGALKNTRQNRTPRQVLTVRGTQSRAVRLQRARELDGLLKTVLIAASSCLFTDKRTICCDFEHAKSWKMLRLLPHLYGKTNNINNTSTIYCISPSRRTDLQLFYSLTAKNSSKMMFVRAFQLSYV